MKGVQSTGVAGTIKHFVGNESEFQRMTIRSDIPERALRELYLMPFERAVRQGHVMALMTGYNRLGGRFMADHQRLLTRVLQLAERVGSFADPLIPAEREDELPEHRAPIRLLARLARCC